MVKMHDILRKNCAIIVFLYVIFPYNALFAQERDFSLFTVYSLSLEENSSSSDLLNASGLMVERIEGNTKEGYKTSSRFALKMQFEKSLQLFDHKIALYESGNGNILRFYAQFYKNKKIDSFIEGTAKKEKGKVFVNYRTPKNHSLEIKNALFPQEADFFILEQAKKGKHFSHFSYYDGIANLQNPTYLFITIGTKKLFQKKGNAAIDHYFQGKHYWPVHIAFYENHAYFDSVPSQEQSYDLFENGFKRNYIFNYGTYKLKATLKKIEFNN